MTKEQYEELAAAVTKVRELINNTDVISVYVSSGDNKNGSVHIWHDSQDKEDWKITPFLFGGKYKQKVKTVNGVEFFVILD